LQQISHNFTKKDFAGTSMLIVVVIVVFTSRVYL
jgi:hypothetical protein